MPLLGELGAVADEPMVGPLVDEIAEPIVEAKEQLPPSTYEVGGPSTVAAEGLSFTLPASGFPIPPSMIEDLSTRMGGAGSADCNPERRGDYRIDPAGTGLAGSCAAERFTDSAAADYGF
nr:hypothetical protein [Tanacetum cinerariifolium]